MKKYRRYLPLLAFILLSLIWSSTWMVLKLGLRTTPPFLAAALRFFFAFLLLNLVMIFYRIPYPRGIRIHGYFFGFSLANFTGGYAFVYWGQQFIPSGLGSILFSVMPFYVMILSIWFLPQETINWKKSLGIMLGFAGLVIIFWERIRFAGVDHLVILGMLAVALAPLFSSAGTIMGKRARQTMDPLALVTFPMFYASVMLSILSLIFEGEMYAVWNLSAIFSLVYLATAGTAIAFSLYFWMLKNTSAVLMSMITLITPPLALIWGALLLNEPVTPFLLIGMVLILGGIFLVRQGGKAA